MKIIYHVDEIEKWNLVIADIKMMLVHSKENHETHVIEVVADAEAVLCLCHRNDEYQAIMEKLSEGGIKFYACYHSFTKRGISSSELYSFVEVVAAGVLELACKQQQGYSYLKP